MRLFFLLFIQLFPIYGFAQDCRTSSGDIPGPGTYNCLNLYIDSPISFGTDPSPVVINVTGNVEITANVTLDGSPGANISAAGTSGGNGGPGAGRGGGIDGFGAPEPGEDPFPGSGTANGKAAPNSFTCGNGGGGGGFFTAGSAGSTCSGSSTAVGAAGGTVPALEFDFGGNFRGGYGGGAGGTAPANEVGSGGGGGGALRIDATGDVTIASGVTISSRGGNGGNALTDGGGGGAGSGGALWIQSSAGVITNLGTIDLRGGTGGRNNVTGGHGGNGGDGVYQFEDLNGTTNGSGLVLPSSSTGGSSGGSSSKLSSDISCGTISKSSDHKNSFFMMFLGFGFISLISSLIRLKRIRAY